MLEFSKERENFREGPIKRKLTILFTKKLDSMANKIFLHFRRKYDYSYYFFATKVDDRENTVET